MGIKSSIASFMACTPPSGMDIPTIYAIDQTHFTVGWSTPLETGGCPLTGYAVFRDDGLGGTLNIPIDPLVIQNKPYLFSYQVTMASSFTGKKI